MPNPNYTEIITTSLEHRNKELADLVSLGNALHSRLSMSGNVRPTSGGRNIVEELEYAENATFQYYTGYETLNISPSDVFTAAEFPWKQASVTISASGLETRIQNSGPEAVIPLLSRRIDNAMRTFKNNLSIGIYSDGTGTSGKQITGLQALVADDPTTGTVGGIDRSNAANAFWRNQTSGDVASIDSDTTGAALETEMKAMWLETLRGGDKTDLIVTDQTLYTNFWNSLTAQQRVTETTDAVRGFSSLKFVTADVVYDGDSGIPANHMYFLNTDFIYLRPHTSTNMVPLERRDSINQDAIVVPIVWAGNLTGSNLARQGVIFT